MKNKRLSLMLAVMSILVMNGRVFGMMKIATGKKPITSNIAQILNHQQGSMTTEGTNNQTKHKHEPSKTPSRPTRTINPETKLAHIKFETIIQNIRTLNPFDYDEAAEKSSERMWNGKPINLQKKTSENPAPLENLQPDAKAKRSIYPVVIGAAAVTIAAIITGLAKLNNKNQFVTKTMDAIYDWSNKVISTVKRLIKR